MLARAAPQQIPTMPDREKATEAFRKIEVTIEDPDSEVRTISGYYPGK